MSQLYLDLQTSPALMRWPSTIKGMEQRKCLSCGRWFYSRMANAIWNCATCLNEMGLIPWNIKPAVKT